MKTSIAALTLLFCSGSLALPAADYRRIICERARKRGSGYNIDAKINGAYVVIGLLYGGRDLDQTIAIATRCGQDSDCNPSSALEKSWEPGPIANSRFTTEQMKHVITESK